MRALCMLMVLTVCIWGCGTSGPQDGGVPPGNGGSEDGDLPPGDGDGGDAGEEPPDEAPELRVNKVEITPDPVRVLAGETVQLVVTARDDQGQALPVPESAFAWSVVSVPGLYGHCIRVNNRGLVTGLFVGEATVQVTHISSGTFYRSTVMVSGYEFVTEWPVRNSTNVAVSASDQVYVTTAVVECNGGCGYVADKIQQFTSSGTFVTEWGSQGSDDGQFYFVGGLAIGPGGKIWVSDRTNDRVQVFSGDGHFLDSWGCRGIGGGMFQQPGALGMDAEGNVYVAEDANSRIQRLTSDGAFLAEWSSFHPVGVAVDETGLVYVASGTSICRYTGTGSRVSRWSSYRRYDDDRWGDVRFADLRAVATDRAGNVYVLQTSGNVGGRPKVLKFTSNGDLLTVFAEGFGSEPGELKQPQSIAVDSEGNVYIADSGNNRIQKFSPGPQQ